MKDLAKQRVANLQYRILIGLLVVDLLAFVALFFLPSGLSVIGIFTVIAEFFLFCLFFYWLRRGHVGLVSWGLIGVLYLTFLSTLSAIGFGVTGVLDLAIFVILAGLLLRPLYVVLVTVISLGTILALPYIPYAGARISAADLPFALLLLGCTGLLLTVASNTLDGTFDEVRRSTDALQDANQQLQTLTSNLEGRVTERTHDLETAAEVGRVVNEKSVDLYTLLTDAVELIGNRFDLYYTQIYLVDPAGRSLILRAGTGDAGAELLRRGHRLPVGRASINGRAVAEKRSVIVTDTRQNENFLPNPLLPETRSEMAVPLLAGDQVLGVLDMQSARPQALNTENVAAFEALAGQLSVAVRNAALFAEAEQARSEMEEQVRRITSRGWQEFLDAVEHQQRIGFSFDQAGVVPLKERDYSAAPVDAVTAHITVTGEKVGAIQVPFEAGQPPTAGEIELLQAVAGQLGQRVDSLRLLAQAERYQAEAEQAIRRLTREGWDAYLETHTGASSGFAFDLNVVAPLGETLDDQPAPAMVQPLLVRDEVVGQLIVNAANDSSEEANELVSAVAEQLSSHIENLRLSLGNLSLLKSAEERARREQLLRQITSALRASTDPATILRTAVRELGSILGRKTVIRMSTAGDTEAAAAHDKAPDTSMNLTPTSAAGGEA